ncbi:CRISPR-associated protein Cas4 [uncultured Dialister sp.]|uniref:CRISPR-associated protein Cas4 n=1 Tax=uncultured Dialister sp. TaxID=278064 RepID=UPI0025F2B158|nr:CRISPR-associated protein Cas4 [uncultured Dialister sp.]
MYAEEDYLMISGIQHFAFCRRQWALIHINQEWDENRLTAEGELIHKNAHDTDFSEKRNGVLIIRGLRVASPALGMTGQCDVVEFTRDESGSGAILQGHRGTWFVRPIEYKRGKDKTDDSDELQLCLEAMCLEEMLSCYIPEGDIFYHEIRRRRTVPLTEELREKVRKAAAEMHAIYQRHFIPKVKRNKRCQSCSLKDICLPKLMAGSNVSDYYSRILEDKF